MTAVVLIILGGFILFCNGCVVATVDKERDENPFFVQWDEEVKSSQDTKIGRFLMKSFYCIPTGVAIISKCKN